MGGIMLENSILLEIWVPQLARGFDVSAAGTLFLSGLLRGAFERLGLCGRKGAVFSMLLERELNPERTLFQEGVTDGDKLILIYF